MVAAPPAASWRSGADRLGAWNLYFIGKLVLVALGLIGLNVPANVVFAGVLVAMAHPKARRFRPWIGVPVAVALLYHDSWLPGFSRVVSQASLVAGFSAAYLAELAGRFVDFKVLGALAVAGAAWFGASRFVRLDVPVFVAILAAGALAGGTREAVVPAAPAGTAAAKPAAPQDPDAMLAAFFAREAGRAVAFPRPPESAPAFDVVFLHVCSLSWDDLAAAGLEGHRLLGRFDIVMKRFNAVSTYSGPAAIRLLRAPCGQPGHKALYSPAPAHCLLMPALEGAGLEPRLVLNHDGHFDGFLGHVREQGMKAAPASLKGIAAPQRAFDDSRIYDDAAILERWLAERPRDPAPRTAVYFNTLSLHDGNRLQTEPATKSSDTYVKRLSRLLDDLDAFVEKLAASGRRAVVVLVPEHGAALRGDAAQIPGLRDVPTPAITLVPVGIRVIGPDARREGEAVVVDEPTSFLAVSHVVARLLERPPFGAAGFRAADYTRGLPATEFVAEGETAVLLRRGEGYLMKLEQDPWKPYR